MSWKLGRAAGIDVYLHPTFFLVLLMPGVLEGGLASIALVLSIFGCVVLHEFGHALMARRYGIETVDITLYPIGGVARLKRMPKAPGAEMLIALAGPAVNVGIALVLGGVALLGLLPDAVIGTRLPEFLTTLLAANLFLALFNLVPAFPMDGGRVLRAALSGWLGRGRATAVAALVGQGLAVAFGVFGLLSGHLMWAALAVFIYFVAGRELASVRAEERVARYDQASDGIWVAPPGFRWVQQGDGVWQQVPVGVPVNDRRPSSWT